MKKTVSALILVLLFASYASAAHTTQSNYFYGTLAGTIGEASTAGDIFSVSLGTNSGALPATGPFDITVIPTTCTAVSSCASREIIRVSARSVNTLTIGERNREGTTHSGAWMAGARVYLLPTAGRFDEMETEIDLLVAKTTTVNGHPLSSNVTLATSDIADSTDKRYVTDAERTVITRTSGTNTGDQDLSGLVSSISSANGDLTVSGNTGTVVITANAGTGASQLVKMGSDAKLPALDASNLTGITQAQVLGLTSALSAKVPTTRQINGYPLSSDVSLVKGDIGLGQVPNTDATNPANTSQTSSYRFVTDTEKATWNAKAPANNPAFTGQVTFPVTGATQCLHVDTFGILTGTGEDCGAGSGMIYPGAGVPKSTGSAWDASYSVGTGANNLVQLNGSGQLPAVSGANLTGIAESQITNLTTDLSAKAPLASPGLTGTPTAPTAAADTNTTQIASTAFVLGQTSSTNPVINGSATAGTSARFARSDHAHPTDSSRAPIASPSFTGTITTPITGATQCLRVNSSGIITGTGADCSSGGGMVYPGAGVARSSGTSWLTSYTVGTSASNLVQLDGSAKLPALDASLLTGITESQVTNLVSDLASKVSKTSGAGPCLYGRTSGTEGCYSSWTEPWGMIDSATTPTTCAGYGITDCGGSGTGTISGSTGTIYSVMVTAGTDSIASSNMTVDPASGVFSTGKSSGSPDWQIWAADHTTDLTGAGFAGPRSASGMGTSYLLKFSETAPTSGQVMSFGTPTTEVITLPTGTATINIIPITWSAASGTTTLASGSTITTPFITTSEIDGHLTTTLTASQVSSTTIYNTGQSTTGNVTISLPAAASGYSFVSTIGTAVTATYYWEIKAAVSDKIYLDGAAGTDNHAVRETAQAVGSYISCYTFKTDAYDWICRSGAGTWVAQ